nr:hypothetical protein [Tanacetum cinerariifolium]
MAPLTFVDTYNMVVLLSMSDASAGIDQIVDFLNTQVIQYALMVNPTIYVSCIKQLWAMASIKKASDIVKLQALIDRKKVVVNENEFSCSMASVVICLATGRKFNFSKYIFDSMVRNVDSPSKFLMYPRFLQVMINNQVDDLYSHTTRYTSPALTQKVFANMRFVGKGFFGVKTPLFSSMLVQPQPQDAEEEDDIEVPAAPTLPSPTNKPSLSSQDPIQTYATLSKKVAELEQEKQTQELEILKLKKRVKKLEKKRRSKHSGFKRLKKAVEIDANEDITLVDMETQVALGAELQGRKDDDNDASKYVNAVEPTVFNDEEYEDKQENIDWNDVVEQIQEKQLDNTRKYQSHMRKPISIAQARKNMIIYLKNMAGYKMEDFSGMTYDKVRPIFEREYNKVQTLFKPDKDVEEPQKKRVAEETLLLESFKKLKVVKAQPTTPSSPPHEQPTNTFESFMTLLNTLLDTCATLSKKIAELEQDKQTQALEILKLKKRVKRHTDEDITMVDMETQVDVGVELQGRKDDDNASSKYVNVAEPNVFDDEEMAKWLHDEERKQAAAREKEEKDNLERAQVLQQHLKRKPVFIAQAKKNMIIYLTNMAGYKMEDFRGMTYDKSFKKLEAVEVLGFESTQETLTTNPKEMSEEDVQNMLEIIPVSEFKVEALQVKYPLIDWEIHYEGSRSHWKIIRVGGITKAYQSFEDMLKGFDRKDLDTLWRLVKENFSSAVPNVDKEKALWVELKRLFEPDTEDVMWKL